MRGNNFKISIFVGMSENSVILSADIRRLCPVGKTGFSDNHIKSENRQTKETCKENKIESKESEKSDKQGNDFKRNGVKIKI